VRVIGVGLYEKRRKEITMLSGEGGGDFQVLSHSPLCFCRGWGRSSRLIKCIFRWARLGWIGARLGDLNINLERPIPPARPVSQGIQPT